MSLAADVSHELDLVDLTGKSENKFDKVLELFAKALHASQIELIAKTISSAANAMPRTNEATNDILKGFFFGVCEFVDEKEYTKSVLLDQARLKVSENRFESVVYLRKGPNPSKSWSVFLVVAKEASPIIEVARHEWPSCSIEEIQSAFSFRKELNKVLKCQSSFTHIAANPIMRARSQALGQVRDQLNWELKRLNKSSDWKSEFSNGQGNAAKIPWVRFANFKHSPGGSRGFFLVFLFSEDGSRAFLSLNQGTTDQAGGGRKLKPQGELRAKADEVRASFAHDASGNFEPELTRHGEPTATIDLGKSDLALQYAAGNVVAFEYDLNQLSSNHSIVCQISVLVQVLEEIYKGVPIVDKIHNELENLVDQTHWPVEELRDVLKSLQDKSPQVVLEGPPGTGKTYVAKRLAEHLVGAQPGEISPDITIVQFHPSYGYEEFVEGLRPELSEGQVVFANRPGPIIQISRKILESGKPHVLIIDELNRANIPRVFGELMYLLEYRDESINLMLGEKFELPENLFIIATMNTADKSIRVMDTALRRRFDFFSVMPSAEILRAFYSTEGNENRLGEDLFQGFTDLNKALYDEIGDDGHLIGHSFFMTETIDRGFLETLWKRQLGPLIREYFFDRQTPEVDFTLERFWPN
jgi:hypothetical protein